MAAPVLTAPGPTTSSEPTRLVAPVDLYVLAVMALMVVVARVGSSRFRSLVVAAVSTIAFRLSHTKRRGSEAALTRVFGSRLSARRRRLVLRGAFRELWSDVFALLPLRGAPGDATTGIAGIEHLVRARAGGRGAILWVSNHLGGMATLKRTLLANGFGAHKVHAEHHLGGFSGGGTTWVQQRIVGPFFDRHERPIVAGVVFLRRSSIAAGRDLARLLRANAMVCAAADGRLGHRFVFRPFLGIPEAFPTGIVTLARTADAPLLPTFCIPRGRTIRVVIQPAVEVPAGLDRDEATRVAIDRYVERLELWVRRHPSRYVNWHMIGNPLPPMPPG